VAVRRGPDARHEPDEPRPRDRQPGRPQLHFASIRRDPEASWNKIKISAFDCPPGHRRGDQRELGRAPDLREWVETVKKEWGEDNPLYISKVLAEYPDRLRRRLITPAMIAKAIAAWEELDGTALGRYAMDVARLGKDKTVVYRNRGGVVEKVKEWSKKDTAETTDRAADLLEPHQGGVPMVIDIGGLGSGPFDNLRKMGFPVFGFDGSTKPWSRRDPRQDGLRFLNRRAEQYWGLREEMDRSALGLDPKNLKAQAQLMNIKWDRTATGRIFIEKKEEIKKRVGEPGRRRHDHDVDGRHRRVGACRSGAERQQAPRADSSRARRPATLWGGSSK
jgi:hypothetical protein